MVKDDQQDVFVFPFLNLEVFVETKLSGIRFFLFVCFEEKGFFFSLLTFLGEVQLGYEFLKEIDSYI